MPVHSAASATDTGSPWAATVASGTWTCTTGTGAGDTTGTSHALHFGRARPCRALRRPPRPLAPLRCAYVSLQVPKCACVVLVQAHGNLLLSVHRWGDRACARARVWACAAQALPNEPTPAGNGSLVPELPNYRTWPRARGHPPWRTVHGKFFTPRM